MRGSRPFSQKIDHDPATAAVLGAAEAPTPGTLQYVMGLSPMTPSPSGQAPQAGELENSAEGWKADVITACDHHENLGQHYGSRVAAADGDSRQASCSATGVGWR